VKQRLIHFKFFCPPAKSFVEDYHYQGAVEDLFNGEDPTLIPAQHTGIDTLYEGDIVQITLPQWNKTYLGHIVFESGAFAVKIHNPQGALNLVWLHQFQAYQIQYKQLGNIYENPEKLEAQTE
jgi:hypothetical protein